MQFKKLSREQKCTRKWRERRNRLVCEILSNDKFISRQRALELANQQMRTKRKPKKDRPSYRKLGFESYAEYLESDLWKAIRSRKLEATPDCELCKKQAVLVHHYCYSMSVMQGLRNDQLFSLCWDCHQKVEFKGGKKRTLAESQKYLRRRLSDLKEESRISSICKSDEPAKKDKPKPRESIVASDPAQRKPVEKLEIGTLRPPPKLAFRKPC